MIELPVRADDRLYFGIRCDLNGVECVDIQWIGQRDCQETPALPDGDDLILLGEIRRDQDGQVYIDGELIRTVLVILKLIAQQIDHLAFLHEPLRVRY